MQNESIAAVSGDAPAPGTSVSANNPCPFLRALVAAGFVDGGVVPLSKLSRTVEAATGEKGFQAKLAGLKTYLVALIANGLSPLRLLRSWWSGAQLDALRDGPLDKHGSGSRILDKTAQVNEAELARLAEFGKDQPNPAGGFERGLTEQEITAYMDANFERAKGHRRRIDRKLMKGEWPVLLHIMGKGEGEERYLSAAEVRTLFVERRLPDRILGRLLLHPQLSAPKSSGWRRFAKAMVWLAVAVVGAAIVAIAEFPDQVGKISHLLADVLPPPLPDPVPTKAAHWLDQNWSTDDRHWFHHASQGTATFPVPYTWFVALEQPGIHLITRPGLLSDSDYLERFGFIPSPKSVNTDEASLRRFGYFGSSSVTAASALVSVLNVPPKPVENFDGLPVGFARLTGAPDPATGLPEADKIGLSCAACHTGHLRYKGVSVRFDGGPAMLDLQRLEKATGLSILYTLYVPGRFGRFAARVLGPEASKTDHSKLKKELAMVAGNVLNEVDVMRATFAAKGQKSTDEGYGRLDALNRIGNQVFYTDLAKDGVAGVEKNLHAQDAPVSFPPIWTTPWFLWAQYDGSIQQPLVRNVGEALGVKAPVNLSPDFPKETRFRSTIALDNLVRVETLLAGPEPTSRTPSFGGLASPKWPSQIFADDPAWQIDTARVSRGRALYAEICAECHLGPIDDKMFDTQFPDKSIWSKEQRHHWVNPDGPNPVLIPVQKSHMGTDPEQAHVLTSRKVYLPAALDIQPGRDLGGPPWNCSDVPASSSTEMLFSVALMIVVDKVSTKWMDDKSVSQEDRDKIWGKRKNCPNPVWDYRARPLNGVWATAPYLHNGSVPSLYWMLTPAAERPKKFCIGARDFDPRDVGFRVDAGGRNDCNKGESQFSTTDKGNSVLGHSLEGTPGKDNPGVIGRLLTKDERYDLIEYLKTL
jgi:mono/diheme cytochrome c family protein